MTEKLYEHLDKAEYEQAAELLSNASNKEIEDTLLTIVYDKDSIAVVGFVLYMFDKTRDHFWLDRAVQLLAGPLCYVTGAYSLAFRYAKLVLEHERSVENLEQMLLFNAIPEKLLSDEDAVKIAKEILASAPDSVTAKRVCPEA